LVSAVSLIIVFVSTLLIMFYINGGYKHFADYLVDSPQYWDNEIVILDFPKDITLDSLREITAGLLNSRARKVINDPPVHNPIYSGRLDTPLNGRINFFVSNTFFKNTLQVSDIKRVRIGTTNYLTRNSALNMNQQQILRGLMTKLA
jgi:hypothetical protein